MRVFEYCDERERQKLFDDEMAEYNERNDLGERVGDIGREFGWGVIEWNEMMTQIQALNPALKRSTT